MKVAVLADVHANRVALQKVIDDARSQSIDQFVILGDIVLIGPDPGPVLNAIRALNPLCWIKGNTDMWFEEISDDIDTETLIPSDKELYAYFQFAKRNLKVNDIDFITRLPMESVIHMGDNDILCVHGSPRSVNEMMDGRKSLEQLKEMVRGVSENIILCGHSHYPYIGEVEGKLIFNVGSVGRPLDGDNTAAYGILDFSTLKRPRLEIRRVNYPIGDTVLRAKAVDFPNYEKYERVLVNARNT